MTGAIEEHGRQIKDGYRGSGVQEQRGDFPSFGTVPSRPHSAKQQGDPEGESGGQENLPQAAQFQVFPPLMTQPVPHVAQHLSEPQELT